MKNIFYFLFLSVLILTVPFTSSWAGEDGKIYKQACQSARAGRVDAAFMDYRAILRDFPSSKYAEKAAFAEGEYYFWMPEYRQSMISLNEFVQKYPESDAKLFALAFLLKMAEGKNDEAFAKVLRQQIIEFKNISLIFKKYDEYAYRSPLYKEYKAIYHIDKVEFLVDQELFLTILF